jgi:hypothetical protein
VLVDIDGGGTDLGGGSYTGYEMAIEMQNQTGTLTNANFCWWCDRAGGDGGMAGPGGSRACGVERGYRFSSR